MFKSLLQPTLPKPLPSAFHICSPNYTRSTGPCILADISTKHSITLSKPHHPVPPSLCVTAPNTPSEKCNDSTHLQARRQPSYPEHITRTEFSRRKSSVCVMSRLKAGSRNIQVAMRSRREIFSIPPYSVRPPHFLFNNQL
jgi:hypothetical protein